MLLRIIQKGHLPTDTHLRQTRIVDTKNEIARLRESERARVRESKSTREQERERESEREREKERELSSVVCGHDKLTATIYAVLVVEKNFCVIPVTQIEHNV